MIKTVTLTRDQKPTAEQIKQIQEQQKEKLYMMMIHRNLLLQWKRHFD